MSNLNHGRAASDVAAKDVTRPDAGARRRLTKTVVANAKPHPNGVSEYVIWDDRLIGFGLRVRPNGHKSYTYKYKLNGVIKRVTIKASTPDEAYDHASTLSYKVNGGVDPVVEKENAKQKAQAATVSDILDDFLRAKTDERKAKTVQDYTRVVEKILKPKIGKIKIDELSKQHVNELYRALLKTPRQPRSRTRKPAHDAPKATAQAHGVMRVLSAAMNWAIQEEQYPIEVNPVKKKLPGTRQRNRLFSDNEVSRLLKAMEDMEAEGTLAPSIGLALKLLFATGCRAGEICSLRWDDIDFEHNLMRWADTKTGAMEKPLTPHVAELLTSKGMAVRIVGEPWVCPAPKGSKQTRQLRVDVLGTAFKRVMAQAEVDAGENASCHLIRHYFSSKIYKDTRISSFVAMAVTGHKSVATAKRYTHVTNEEKLAAAHMLSTSMGEAIEAAGNGAQVVALQRANK